MPDKQASSPMEFLTLFQSLESRLRQFLLRSLVSPQDIDDAIQETFLRSYASGKDREIAFPKAFIFKIAENLALSEIRRKSHQLLEYMGEIEALDLIDERSSPLSRLEAEEQLEKIMEAVTALSPQCRKVVVMRKIYGMSQAEIAGDLNLSVKTVENHLTRGLRRCQQSLDGTLRLFTQADNRFNG